MRLGVASAAAAVTAIALAPAALSTESTIHPGVGIGNVKLGMTATQVKKILGRDYLVNTAENVRGRRHFEYGWDYSRWTVTFEQRGRTLRAVQVTTVIPNQKTAKKVGPGSTWHQLVHAYPHGVCTFNNDRWGRADYLVTHKRGTQTIYIVRQPRGREGGPWRIAEVVVRQPWIPLPQFSPAWNADCGDDWRSGDHP